MFVYTHEFLFIVDNTHRFLYHCSRYTSTSIGPRFSQASGTFSAHATRLRKEQEWQRRWQGCFGTVGVEEMAGFPWRFRGISTGAQGNSWEFKRFWWDLFWDIMVISW